MAKVIAISYEHECSWSANLDDTEVVNRDSLLVRMAGYADMPVEDVSEMFVITTDVQFIMT